jgi:hypothetical protein
MQYTMPTIDPATNNGTDLANFLNQWKAAVESQHYGPVRPTYATAGTIWVDSDTNLAFLFNGTTDLGLLLPGATLTAPTAATTPIILKAIAGQTAPLLQVRDATNGSLAQINKDGVIFSRGLAFVTGATGWNIIQSSSVRQQAQAGQGDGANYNLESRVGGTQEINFRTLTDNAAINTLQMKWKFISQTDGNFYLFRYDAAGAYAGNAISFMRDSKETIFDGRVRADGGVQFSNDATFYAADQGPAKVFAFAPNWFWGYDEQTGNLGWNTAAHGQFQLLSNGVLVVPSNIYAGASPQGIGLIAGVNPALQFAGDWTLSFEGSSGSLSYLQGTTLQWMYRQADALLLNNKGRVGGMGPYADLSDERTKGNIASSPYGLREIGRLRPVQFQRMDETGTLSPAVEIGFIAQEVRDVIPEAVITADFGPTALAEGGEPLLALSTDPIVAALVSAVQELTVQNRDLAERLAYVERKLAGGA